MLDVIITSTCRNTIKATLKSFITNVHYEEGFNFIINIDVLYPSNLKNILNYFKKMKINNISINHHPGELKRYTPPKAINILYKKIESPYFVNMQDDWIFLKEIKLNPLVQLMEKNSYINHIRFSKEKINEKTWLYHLSDRKSERVLKQNNQFKIDDISLVKTYVWSLNPSLVRTKIVKEFSETPNGFRAETHLCKEYYKKYGYEGCYTLGKIGENASVKDIGRVKLRKLREIGIWNFFKELKRDFK